MIEIAGGIVLALAAILVIVVAVANWRALWVLLCIGAFVGLLVNGFVG